MVVRDPALGVAGTISYWPLRIGEAGTKALLLGPIAIHRSARKGIGLTLMRTTLAKAAAMGHALVISWGMHPIMRAWAS